MGQETLSADNRSAEQVRLDELKAGVDRNNAERIAAEENLPEPERTRRREARARGDAAVARIEAMFEERKAIVAKLSPEDQRRLEEIDQEMRRGSEHLV